MQGTSRSEGYCADCGQWTSNLVTVNSGTNLHLSRTLCRWCAAESAFPLA